MTGRESLSERHQKNGLNHVASFTRRQIGHLREGGQGALYKKISILHALLSIYLKKLCDIPPVLLAMPVVLVVRMLRPLWLIRFGPLTSSRIGHFLINTELYLRSRDAEKNNKRTIDVLYYEKTVCNSQLKKMWERVLSDPSYGTPVIRLAKWLDRANRILPGGEEHTIPPLFWDSEKYGIFEDKGTHLYFTTEEEESGKEGLKKIGIRDAAQFVCFSARTTAYLDTVFSGRKVWGYHDFRNSDVYNYIPAAKELVRLGYYAVRMGAVVEERLRITDPRIIDYAVTDRTEFLDLYLGATCRFFITDVSGICMIPMVFGRPIAWVNYIPIVYPPRWCSEDLFIPKKLWLKDDHRFLTFREILDSDIKRYFYTVEYERAGIEIVENTPEEISAVAHEMHQRLNNKWQDSEEDEDLQNCIKSYFKANDPVQNSVSRMGAEFLRQNRELLK